MKKLFHNFAVKVAALAGSAYAFAAAFSIVVLWIVSGSLFNFSDTWQLVINTGTTIITFLMIFLVQHTQNVDTKAMNTKLDEIIRVMPKASNELIEMEKHAED